MVDFWKVNQNFCDMSLFLWTLVLTSLILKPTFSILCLWKVLYWYPKEQKFFLSTEIGVSLKESYMACDLSLCVIEYPRSALAPGFEQVVTSSTSHVWMCIEAKGTHHNVSLCYAVISLLIDPLVTLTSIGLMINGLVHQDPRYFGFFIVSVCLCECLYSLINC